MMARGHPRRDWLRRNRSRQPAFRCRHALAVEPSQAVRFEQEKVRIVPGSGSALRHDPRGERRRRGMARQGPLPGAEPPAPSGLIRIAYATPPLAAVGKDLLREGNASAPTGPGVRWYVMLHRGTAGGPTARVGTSRESRRTACSLPQEPFRRAVGIYYASEVVVSDSGEGEGVLAGLTARQWAVGAAGAALVAVAIGVPT